MSLSQDCVSVTELQKAAQLVTDHFGLGGEGWRRLVWKVQGQVWRKEMCGKDEEWRGVEVMFVTFDFVAFSLTTSLAVS